MIVRMVRFDNPLHIREAPGWIFHEMAPSGCASISSWGSGMGANYLVDADGPQVAKVFMELIANDTHQDALFYIISIMMERKRLELDGIEQYNLPLADHNPSVAVLLTLMARSKTLAHSGTLGQNMDSLTAVAKILTMLFVKGESGSERIFEGYNYLVPISEVIIDMMSGRAGEGAIGAWDDDILPKMIYNSDTKQKEAAVYYLTELANRTLTEEDYKWQHQLLSSQSALKIAARSVIWEEHEKGAIILTEMGRNKTSDEIDRQTENHI